jgi:hypothetical protein
MELISAFKSELFRPLVTLLIPGGIATAPYLVLLIAFFPQARSFGHDYPSTAVAIALAVITGVGLVLEDWGSRIEYFWDVCLDRRNVDQTKTWRKYLQLRLRDEIVGQRYLRTFLVRFKFELAMGPAWIAFAAGAIWLDHVTHFWTLSARFVLLPFALAVYSVYESYQTAKVMGDTRKLIVAAVESAPSKMAGTQADRGLTFE